jgi:hypothetical protein
MSKLKLDVAPHLFIFDTPQQNRKSASVFVEQNCESTWALVEAYQLSLVRKLQNFHTASGAKISLKLMGCDLQNKPIFKKIVCLVFDV